MKQPLKIYHKMKNKNLEETICTTCAGLKKLVVNGKEIPPANWMQFKISADIGCLCK